MSMMRLVLVLILGLGLVGGSHATTLPGEALRIAVHLGALRDVNRTDTEVTIKFWGEEMAREMGIPAQVEFYSDIDLMRHDLDTGKVNFVIAEPVIFLRNFRLDQFSDGFGGASSSDHGMVLLIRKDGAVREPRDLVGKRLGRVREHALSDILLNALCLNVLGDECRAVLDYQGVENRFQTLIMKVFFGKVDAALVTERAYRIASEMNPQLREQLMVMKRFDIYWGSVGLFDRRVDKLFREQVLSRAGEIWKKPRGRQILEILQTDRVERFSKDRLQAIETLLREYDLARARVSRTRFTR